MCGVKKEEKLACDNNGAAINNLKINSLSPDALINFDHGDPKMFVEYWRERDEECAITISASHLLSYFSDATNVCWYLEPCLADAIRRLHRTVGNALLDDRYIIVGTGSSQLFQATLYALTCDSSLPFSIVSAAPYYSCYPDLSDFLKSGLYKWAGDANTFKGEGPYIEVITSPNNPDGRIRKPVVGREDGKRIYDLAYYWPQYTPITAPLDHDIMLFTVSKCTGHAGSRIGWALVKEEAVARKMTKFIEMTTIGTSKEAQLRASLILNSISDCYDHPPAAAANGGAPEGFFEYGHRVMAERWRKLIDAVECSEAFTLLGYPEEYCNFKGKITKSYPAFAWMECKKGEDGAKLMLEHSIRTRAGPRFGVHPKFIRVSMVDTDPNFNLFLHRLSSF